MNTTFDPKIPRSNKEEMSWMQKSEYSRINVASTYFMYGSTSARLVNTYSMIVRHSAFFKFLFFEHLHLG